MSEWQPIETAPRNMQTILGAHKGSGVVRVTWRSAIGDDRYSADYMPEGRFWRPTHWMPLPEPPK
jgi:hypothetical protein